MNNMNTEERLKKIADARKKMDLEQLSKKEQERNNIAEYCEKFGKYSDRIKAMILVAEGLCKNNIPLGKLSRHPIIELPEHEFCSDGISHKFGFVTTYPFTESKNIDIIGIGHVGGGMCGTDFILFPDGQVKYSKYYCRSYRNNNWVDFDFEDMEKKLLDFEERFYQYVDNL